MNFRYFMILSLTFSASLFSLSAHSQSTQDTLVRQMTFEQMDRDVKKQKRMDERAQSPILYGEGVAGITFKTSLSEASQTLEIAPTGTVIAWKGLDLIWSQGSEGQGPAGIFVGEDYKGTLNLPEILHMGQSVPYSASEEGLKSLAQRLYNSLEKKDTAKVSKYNCVNEKTCAVYWDYKANPEQVVVDLPRMLVILQKNDLRLKRIYLKAYSALEPDLNGAKGTEGNP